MTQSADSEGVVPVLMDAQVFLVLTKMRSAVKDRCALQKELMQQLVQKRHLEPSTILEMMEQINRWMSYLIMLHLVLCLGPNMSFWVSQQLTSFCNSFAEEFNRMSDKLIEADRVGKARDQAKLPWWRTPKSS